MRTKEISKYQFIVTVTPSEHLIMEGYANLFHVTLQDAALIMCVHGWNSYANKMIQYNKSCRIEPSNHHGQKLLDQKNMLDHKSPEGKAFSEFMDKVNANLPELLG